MLSYVSLLFQLMIQTVIVYTGGNMDANVVFSQQSYIPRSANFNFTTDLFGHSLNLLEVGFTYVSSDYDNLFYKFFTFFLIFIL